MAAEENGGAADKTPKVKWDDSKMSSTYANVCNVASTREEMLLFFGINQNWDSASNEVTVQLSDRIILSPYAAHRLYTLLGNTLAEYEKRYGPLAGGPGKS